MSAKGQAVDSEEESITPAEEQSRILTRCILGIPEMPRPNEGIGDCAVRLLNKYRGALKRIVDELGVPGEGYPAPVANAYEIAKAHVS